MSNMSPEEEGYIKHSIQAGLLRSRPPQAVADGLVEKGFAYHGVGGLVFTESAYKQIGNKK